jgi:hypothetical protein
MLPTPNILKIILIKETVKSKTKDCSIPVTSTSPNQGIKSQLQLGSPYDITGIPPHTQF